MHWAGQTRKCMHAALCCTAQCASEVQQKLVPQGVHMLLVRASIKTTPASHYNIRRLTCKKPGGLAMHDVPTALQPTF